MSGIVLLEDQLSHREFAAVPSAPEPRLPPPLTTQGMAPLGLSGGGRDDVKWLAFASAQ